MANDYLNLKTIVTDAMLCCLWPKVIDCIYDGGLTKCYGIIKNMASLILFIALTILAATTVGSISIKTFLTTFALLVNAISQNIGD